MQKPVVIFDPKERELTITYNHGFLSVTFSYLEWDYIIEQVKQYQANHPEEVKEKI